ncbi:MAG: excinuclease ABC subunit UvrA, partial [Deltaproteobacteria bacterium]|nr:excinuclease ABC subunit UvrA [Deltaproteobacteria bacterium]
MTAKAIEVRGARQNNLKDLDIDLPLERLIVVTGLSGSGKSSLALDTLYAEGQRRYIESLSTYARQFLVRLPKPDVDSIRNIPPAIAIVQHNPAKNSRSTVGTSTEVYDYLRLLWAKVGTVWCAECDRAVRAMSPSPAALQIVGEHTGGRAYVVFPVGKASIDQLKELPARGFTRFLAGGKMLRLPDSAEDAEALWRKLARARDGAVVVDRLAISEESRGRLAEALETAFAEGNGVAEVRLVDGPTLRFVNDLRCTGCHRAFEAPTPKLFSFNSPHGACPTCRGFGNTLDYDELLIVPDSGRSLAQGAIDPFTKPSLAHWQRRMLAAAKGAKVKVDLPWRSLTKREREWVMRGERTRSGQVKRGGFGGALGLFERLEAKRYKLHVRVFLSRYKSQSPCTDCGGRRLRAEAYAVRLGGLDIAAACRMPVNESRRFFADLALDAQEADIAHEVLKQVRARLEFLEKVGLSYLTLDRLTRTLSGGEAQRIQLAGQLGSQLAGTLYVLDEPSVGLHARDARMLIEILFKLRDNGNTVVVVEHDREVIRSSDHVIEMGPQAGERGGAVVWQGARESFEASPTLTARYLRGELQVASSEARRPGNGKMLVLTGAREHNLKDLTVRIPLNRFVCVTGVSGSGKSTLVHRTLVGALSRHFQMPVAEVGAHDTLEGAEHLKGVAMLDQAPIGRTPRSNPITYLKAFDEIRKLFAAEPLARSRRIGSGNFSFNVPGGRCETCTGEGFVRIDMHFLEDIYVRCEACRGRRYREETLAILHKRLNIHETLQLTARQALNHFADHPRLRRVLRLLVEVGLGYLRLGQSANTLSGGEAQRLKIAAELSQAGRRDFLYVLDEPTTGLHMDDVRKLLAVLDRLVRAGNTVLVIEHNLDVIRTADLVIDLGPEGGDEGGRIVAEGPPEAIARC